MFWFASWALATGLALAVAGADLPGRAGELFETPPSARTNAWPVYVLSAAEYWHMNLPGGQRFDASGLFLTRDKTLLTESDRGAAVYRVVFKPDRKDVDLERLPDCFTPEQLAPFAKDKIGRYDCEGVTEDAQGRIYLCEESNRWVLRWDPATRQVERLAIDWRPVARYFDPADLNASFEGIAIHEPDLFVANERQLGRIIVVDLPTLKIKDDFMVRPHDSVARDVQYSDLCWFDGALYVLCRANHCLLKVNPTTHAVLAEYSFAAMEDAPPVSFRTFIRIGLMEGLAVDADTFWLTTDNNGFGRWQNPKDRRPVLFRCLRPDRRAQAGRGN